MKKDDPLETQKYPAFTQEAPPTPPPIPQGMDMNEPKSVAHDVASGNLAPTAEASQISTETPLQQSQVSQVLPQEEKSSKYPILLGFLVILALAVYGFVAYLYFDIQKLKDESQKASDKSATSHPTPTQTVETFQYLIENGNIKKAGSAGTENIIIRKDDYSSTGLIGFTNVIPSDKGNYICFWSLPPALKPALYYSDNEGASVKLIKEKVKNCVWGSKENKLAYINDVGEGLPVDIFLYDLENELEKNLTNQATASGVFRRYEATSFSSDDSKVICSYEEINKSQPSLETLGNCEIDIATSKITDL